MLCRTLDYHPDGFRDDAQTAVKELKLLLQIIAEVADSFVDSPAGSGRPSIVLDAERRCTPVLKAVVGLKLAGCDKRAKTVSGW